MNDKIVICGARGGSSRVLNKNIRKLGEIPLIEYSLFTGELLGLPIYVSSDSDKILKIVKTHGSLVNIIKRPSILASNTSTDIDWIKHLLSIYYEQNSSYPKQLIFLRPTTPLREISIVKEAIKKFNGSKYTSLRSVEELKESIYKTYFIKNCILEPFNKDNSNVANQTLPISYGANGYIDILLTEQILNSNDIYGDKIMPFITPRTIEIDDEFDFKLAEKLI
jgi:CMP-N-acetylneuraminic acid synthetase